MHTICAKNMRNILLSEREGYGGRLQLVNNDTLIPQTCDEILEKPCPMMLVVSKILGLSWRKIGIFVILSFSKVTISYWKLREDSGPQFVVFILVSCHGNQLNW